MRGRLRLWFFSAKSKNPAAPIRIRATRSRKQRQIPKAPMQPQHVVWLIVGRQDHRRRIEPKYSCPQLSWFRASCFSKQRRGVEIIEMARLPAGAELNHA